MQPNATGNGSPEDIIAPSIDEAARELKRWVDALVSKVGGLETELQIAAAIDRAAEDIDPEKLAALIEETIVRSAMLGAVDAMVEREGDEDEPLPQLASWRNVVLQKKGGSDFAKLPFQDAVQLFEERKILPKPIFDQLTAAAKKKAFTVAGLAAEELLAEAHGELARQLKESRERTYKDEATGKWVYKGPNLREFDRFARERLESAGWTPANPSHVETIFRTNVMSAYGSGRIVESTQPAVLKARPYWQIRAVGDSRTRRRHKDANNTILAASHSFWRRAYAPFGFNCRCRIISRSQKWVDAHGGPTRVPDGLPDPGFDSGIDASLVPHPLPVESEGGRAPTPGLPAHPIERYPRLKPISKPIHIGPPPVAATPPVLPATPVAPAPYQPPPTGVTTGTHVQDMVADRKIGKAKIATVTESYNRDELAWMASNPMRVLEIRKKLVVRGRKANGSYHPGTDTLSVLADRAKGTWGEKLVPGKTWSVSISRGTADKAIQATARHELGHRLHLRAPQHIQAKVSAAYRTGNHITEYAKDSPAEYFAESYAMYREDQALLASHDPVGFRLVREVLDYWGIPHASP